MKVETLAWLLAPLLLVACEDEVIQPPPPQPEPAATEVAPAPPTASAKAAPSASAAAVDRCKERGLDHGGTGTAEDRCKLEGDVLVATATERTEDAGTVFSVDNPWEDEVTRIWVAVYYYDAEGKQLTVEQQGKTLRLARKDDMTVKLPGKTKTELPLGFPKAEIPPDTAKIQAHVWAFGIGTATDAIFFQSETPFSEFRGVDGGDGPTGIVPCDNYRALLESCPKQFPDALDAMRKSLRQFNNSAPQMKERLSSSLSQRCEKGITVVEEKCKEAAAP
ncbi:MAG: hypothetical protein R3B72_06640 [Polyangiaceae bacterium]